MIKSMLNAFISGNIINKLGNLLPFGWAEQIRLGHQISNQQKRDSTIKPQCSEDKKHPFGVQQAQNKGWKATKKTKKTKT